MKKPSSPLWHPFSPLVGGDEILPVESGKGAILTLEDGREIIDGISSWWVNIHGHSHPVIARAIARQARKLEQVIFAGFSHRPARELAENLLNMTLGKMQRVFFSDDGSTAVEVALKIALQAHRNRSTGRHTVVAFDGAYHGDTFGAMAAGERGLFSHSFESKLFPVKRLPWPGHDMTQGGLERCVQAAEKLASEKNTAILIYEPLVQGAAGMRFAHLQTQAAMLDTFRRHGVTLIADEVMTGFGRTGRPFASRRLGVLPDLMCLSKGITGGFLPMGATLVSPGVADAFSRPGADFTFWHGHSYTANPLACAAANASIDLLVTLQSIHQQIRLQNGLGDLAEHLRFNPHLRNVRHMGKILAFEVEDPAGASGYEAPIRNRLYRGFLEQGVLLRPLGNTVYLIPPYVLTPGQLLKIKKAIDHVIGDIHRSSKRSRPPRPRTHRTKETPIP